VNALVPSEIQLDALREVANIGCGHAANALAQLVGGHRVDLSVPRALVMSAAEVAEQLGGDEPVVSAKFGIRGELRGVMLFVMPPEDSTVLGAVLLGQVSGGVEMESALSEAANIVASACLSAIGTLTRWKLMPTLPTLQRGPAREVVLGAVRETEGEARRVVVLETRFSAEFTSPVSGQMLLVLERESSRALLQRLGV
jgi:chemotaxis protein CheC